MKTEAVVEVIFGDETLSSGHKVPTTLGGPDSKTVMFFDEGSVWAQFDVEIPITGRYRTELLDLRARGTVWVEDYVENVDGRTYDITGPIEVDRGVGTSVAPQLCRPWAATGLPSRPVRIGCACTAARLSSSRAACASRSSASTRTTPKTLTQSTAGTDWHLVWSDEFDGMGLPDQDVWTHDIGNWGWGNREPQYYTEGATKNARQENGHLIIEAHPNDGGNPWTSARLTTRGKVSFLYGRIEIRAKVPSADGTWAAGWLLGDDYRDEISWPYCGEVDIMEPVGREIDDATGDGINHGSCHTRAYYFKANNHISNTIPVKDMEGRFHTYACEWDEKEVRMYVDGEHYYTYDKHDSEHAWPFDRPQNLILNLAMGGGMGGPIAEGIDSQRIVVDYVRVHERR